MKTYIFPGQGSQAKGMGRALFDEFKEETEKADKILGYSIKELCLEDPRNELHKTQFTQPALFIVNTLFYLKKIKETGEKPDFLAGHSLGEFNALLAGECFSFETGLELVKKRGELMGRAKGGGMAAVLNTTKEEIETIFEKNNLKHLEVANYNTPTQIVISGSIDEIEKAQLFFQEGKILYIPLNTSGAFHSSYMEPAKKEFKKFLTEYQFSKLKIPVISNVTARPYQEDDVIENLSNQITHSVRWTDSIQYLMGMGDMAFEEVGHGNVLTKLVYKIKEETPGCSKRKTGDLQKESTHPDKPPVGNEKDENYIQIDQIEKEENLTAEEKVNRWNVQYPVGTRVKSMLFEDEHLITRTEAMVLFGHRSAVYLEGYNGYFDLDEIKPI